MIWSAIFLRSEDRNGARALIYFLVNCGYPGLRITRVADVWLLFEHTLGTYNLLPGKSVPSNCYQRAVFRAGKEDRTAAVMNDVMPRPFTD